MTRRELLQIKQVRLPKDTHLESALLERFLRQGVDPWIALADSLYGEWQWDGSLSEIHPVGSNRYQLTASDSEGHTVSFQYELVEED